MESKKEYEATWIPVGVAFRGSFECSGCGSIYKMTDKDHLTPTWKYCPNCGSFMKRIDGRTIRERR